MNQGSSKRILVTGGTGLIGSSLISFLEAKGFEILLLTRKKGIKNGIFWDPSIEKIPLDQLEDFDSVVHLAGENIAGIWTSAKRRKIFLSRCRDTWLLAEGLTRLKKPPRTFLAASAIGIYGSRPGEILTEKSASGKGFLADLCIQWEKASSPLRSVHTRILHARFGPVLSPLGGMLGKMIPLFRRGWGAELGSGKQMISWIAINDVIGAIDHLLENTPLNGAFNFVASQPVTQAEFAHELATALGSTVKFRIPGWFLRFFGDMAHDVFLTDQYVSNKKLVESGYQFQFSSLQHFFSSF